MCSRYLSTHPHLPLSNFFPHLRRTAPYNTAKYIYIYTRHTTRVQYYTYTSCAHRRAGISTTIVLPPKFRFYRLLVTSGSPCSRPPSKQNRPKRPTGHIWTVRGYRYRTSQTGENFVFVFEPLRSVIRRDVVSFRFSSGRVSISVESVGLANESERITCNGDQKSSVPRKCTARPKYLPNASI